jgi:hypothetical protein
MMEAVSSSETSVNIYHTTRCYIPEDSHLHTRRLRMSNLTETNIFLLSHFIREKCNVDDIQYVRKDIACLLFVTISARNIVHVCRARNRHHTEHHQHSRQTSKTSLYISCSTDVSGICYKETLQHNLTGRL